MDTPEFAKSPVDCATRDDLPFVLKNQSDPRPLWVGYMSPVSDFRLSSYNLRTPTVDLTSPITWAGFDLLADPKSRASRPARSRSGAGASAGRMQRWRVQAVSARLEVVWIVLPARNARFT